MIHTDTINDNNDSINDDIGNNNTNNDNEVAKAREMQRMLPLAIMMHIHSNHNSS